jgi:hypothetical protein
MFLSPPSTKIYPSKRHFISLLTKIYWFLVLPNLPHLCSCHNVCEGVIALVWKLHYSTFEVPGQDFHAEPRLLAQRPREADAVNDLERFHHGAHCLESAGDESLRPFGSGGDDIGELEEEGLTLPTAISFVLKCQLFVYVAGKLEKVEAKCPELLTQPLALFWVKPLTLELGRVEPNTNNDARRNSRPDFCCGFKDYTRTVLEADRIHISAEAYGANSNAHFASVIA